MSIESSLERIATALEILAGQKESVSSEPSSDPEPSSPKKSKPSPKPSKKSSDGPTKDDVREALKKLQKAHGPQAARTLLADHNARTLGELDVDAYEQAIADAEERAKE